MKTKTDFISKLINCYGFLLKNINIAQLGQRMMPMANVTKIFYKPLCSNWMKNSESKKEQESVSSITITETNVIAMAADENITLTKAQQLKVNYTINRNSILLGLYI